MEIEQFIKALGEPMRFRIFQALLERKHCVRSLSKKFNVTESAISQHMKILKETELVYGERYGYHIHYFPQQEAIDVLAEAFKRMCQQSFELDRGPYECQCEFRRKKNECND